LLGILYTVLARSGIEGVRSEGESRRRLEASLVADDRLAEIELAFSEDSAPPVGRTEETIDGFHVVTEVRGFERPPPKADPRARGGRPDSLAARRARNRRRTDAPSLFAPQGQRVDSPLRTVEIAVQWNDGIFPREVRRTTYGLDQTLVEAVLELAA